MIDIEKMRVIERHLGGPGKAAQACGVSLTSWGRWKRAGELSGERQGLGRAMIDMLYAQCLAGSIARCAGCHGEDISITE